MVAAQLAPQAAAELRKEWCEGQDLINSVHQVPQSKLELLAPNAFCAELLCQDLYMFSLIEERREIEAKGQNLASAMVTNHEALAIGTVAPKDQSGRNQVAERSLEGTGADVVETLKDRPVGGKDHLVILSLQKAREGFKGCEMAGFESIGGLAFTQIADDRPESAITRACAIDPVPCGG